jgi:small ligand-binding sensory domain FIST
VIYHSHTRTHMYTRTHSLTHSHSHTHMYTHTAYYTYTAHYTHTYTAHFTHTYIAHCTHTHMHAHIPGAFESRSNGAFASARASVLKLVGAVLGVDRLLGMLGRGTLAGHRGLGRFVFVLLVCACTKHKIACVYLDTITTRRQETKHQDNRTHLSMHNTGRAKHTGLTF